MKICLEITQPLEKIAKLAALKLVSSLILTEEYLDNLNQNELDSLQYMFGRIPTIFDCIDENHPIDAIAILNQKRMKLAEKIGIRQTIFPINLDFNGFRILNQIKQSKQNFKIMSVIHPSNLLKVNSALELESDFLLLRANNEHTHLGFEEEIQNVVEIRNKGLYKTRIMTRNIHFKYGEEVMISDYDLERLLS